jgi:hypothetical protein
MTDEQRTKLEKAYDTFNETYQDLEKLIEKYGVKDIQKTPEYDGVSSQLLAEGSLKVAGQFIECEDKQEFIDTLEGMWWLGPSEEQPDLLAWLIEPSQDAWRICLLLSVTGKLPDEQFRLASAQLVQDS